MKLKFNPYDANIRMDATVLEICNFKRNLLTHIFYNIQKCFGIRDIHEESKISHKIRKLFLLKKKAINYIVFAIFDPYIEQRKKYLK